MKKFIPMILVLILVASSVACSQLCMANSPDTMQMGDVNGNGSVDAGDATLTLRYVVGICELTDVQQQAADLNQNGRVDSGDASMILRLVVDADDTPDTTQTPDASQQPDASETPVTSEVPLTPEPTDMPEPTNTPEPTEDIDNMKKLEIIVGTKTFTATLYDNPSASAFYDMLPLTLDMSELNGNEKYYYLDSSLPTDSSRPSGINAGDIMLYGNNCLVLFYESFQTSYSYTPLGRVDDPAELKTALGSGDVQVTFKIDQ